MAVAAEIFAGITLFAGLPPELLAAIAEAAHRRHYHKAMLVFAAGEPTEAVYFVESGAVRVFRATEDGHEQTLQVLRAGDPVNLVGFADGSPYPASAETTADSDLLVISRADFARLAKSHGELGWVLLRELSRRLRWSQGRIYDFALRSAAGRVASALLDLARQRGKHQADGSLLLATPLTHRELGLMAGISRETATRMLQRLREDGAIHWTQAGFFVVDPKRMEPWLDPRH